MSVQARSRSETSTTRRFELQDGPGVNPANVGREVPHGVILKTVATNICGSDQHMVRGRTTAPEGLVLGHEITGEVVEKGRDVEFIEVGDLVLGAVQHLLRPLPQLQGGQDRHLPQRQPRPAGLGVRLRRHGRLGRRPGRVRDGAVRRLEPAEVPRPGPGDGEDPRPDDALRHLPDRLPRLRQRRRRPPGSTVYIAGAGPVGLAAAPSALLLGAAVVIVGDLNAERLAQARSFGCETVDVSQGDPQDQIEQILGVPEVDCARRRRRVRGPRARAGRAADEAPATRAELADGSSPRPAARSASPGST